MTVMVIHKSRSGASKACAAAARHYHVSLGWTIVLGGERPAVALSVGDQRAGVDIAAQHTEFVNQRLVEVGLLGPVIGCPDGRQVHLVTCHHPSGEPPEPSLDPGVVHLGVGGLVYPPPTPDPHFADMPLVWLHGPGADIDLPDCERLFVVVRDIIRGEHGAPRATA